MLQSAANLDQHLSKLSLRVQNCKQKIEILQHTYINYTDILYICIEHEVSVWPSRRGRRIREDGELASVRRKRARARAIADPDRPASKELTEHTFTLNYTLPLESRTTHTTHVAL